LDYPRKMTEKLFERDCVTRFYRFRFAHHNKRLEYATLPKIVSSMASKSPRCLVLYFDPALQHLKKIDRSLQIEQTLGKGVTVLGLQSPHINIFRRTF
jgi:hypothetical protein